MATKYIFNPLTNKLDRFIDLVNFIKGTTNQIVVTDNGDNTITLSAPQNLNTTSDVTFNDVTINGNLLGLGGYTGDLLDSTNTKIAVVDNGLITSVIFMVDLTLAQAYLHKGYRVADGFGVIEY